MPCYHPLRAVLVAGKSGNTLAFSSKFFGKSVSLPCGRCIGCRLERARQWAVRIMHESKMHEENSFITLTYDPEHLPKNGSIVVEHCQLFLKRFRKALEPQKIRFFLCGEYGEKLGRPHYHAIIFGYFPSRDSLPLSFNPLDPKSFLLPSTSLLSTAWGKGQIHIGSVTFESAAYVANYATKKITNKKEYIDHEGKIWPSSSQHYNGRCPEFLLMSRRPGIGRAWFDKFSSDVFPSDEIIVRGLPARPPRYYDGMLEVRDPAQSQAVKLRRELKAEILEEMVLKSGARVSVAPGRNNRRLVVCEAVALAKHRLKNRNLEKQ